MGGKNKNTRFISNCGWSWLDFSVEEKANKPFPLIITTGTVFLNDTACTW
ncbi:hypothetical protein IWX76_003451 [Pedobacter sp. CAN_A7]